MRDDEISWLSWEAPVISTLPDMVAVVLVFVVCTVLGDGKLYGGAKAHPAGAR